MTTSPRGVELPFRDVDACLIRQGGTLRRRRSPDTAGGFAQLSAWRAKYKAAQAHACRGATGAYGEPLSTYLYEAGHAVSVINPAVVEAYGESRLSRAKTDKADATPLARLCGERRRPAWRPLPAGVRELQALARRLDSLPGVRGMEADRPGVAGTRDVRESLAEHVAYLGGAVARTQQRIGPHPDSRPGRRGRRGLLPSIPGVGETTAAELPSEIMGGKPYRGARQLAASAGLAPRLRESGTGSRVRRKARLSRTGARRLRKAL